MQEYFVDAWYLIARIDRFDAHHSTARRLDQTLGRRPFVTHEAVLAEVLTFFSGYGAENRRRAAATVRAVLNDYIVEPADHALFLAALELYESRPDKEYSLVDCMSMQLMRARGITHVLTNDHHFRQEGFTVVSE
ncbi:MAG TPA: PIN domain-containing protein [Thermoanaerobaculia bacterium]|jgi:predicted nucleic acid-binding protein